MHLKQTGPCSGVLLLYTITTITVLPAAAVYSPPPNSHLLPLHHDRSRGLAPEGPPPLPQRGGRERPRRGDESRPPPHFHNLEDGARQRAEASGLTPEHAATSAGKGPGSRSEPTRRDGPDKDCDRGVIEHVIPGRFSIAGPLESLPNVGYQADSAAPGGRERVGGQAGRGHEASWQKLQPVVHCGDHAMTLTVRRRRATQLQLGRVKESSVPLSQLPGHCGYSVHSAGRDLSLTAPYDACHVTQEGDGYALPLLWRGTPVKMSCPAPQPEAAGPYTLCCSLHSMTVKVKGLHSTEELRVNVRGKWNPLGELAEVCGYTVNTRDSEMIIAAPFTTCGVTVKDGNYTLSLQIGERTVTLACPVSPPEELSLTHQPVVNSPPLTRGREEHLPEPLLPFPWVPPFYLAPPYHPHPTYPHPTYPHKYPSPEEHVADNPATPDPTLGPQPPPAADLWTDEQNYPPQPIPARESDEHFGLHSSLLTTDGTDNSGPVYPEPPVLGGSERHSATRSLRSDTGGLIQGDSPTPLQPPSHAFNPYYHYYHHPKIPLPGAPKDSDPGPQFSRELTLTNSNNPENPVFPLNMQRPEVLRRINSQQVLQPVPKAASHPYTLTSPTKASALDTPGLPQPYPYHSHYPPPIAPLEARRMAPLNPDTAAKNNLSNAFIHPLPCSSYGYNINNDGQRLSAPADKPPLTYHPGQDAGGAPPTDRPAFPTASPYYNLPYLYHYHMYYGPGGSPSAGHRPSQTSGALVNVPPALAPQRPSHLNHQSITTPTKSTNDVPNDPLYPYYYHFHSNTQQQPYDALGRPGGEEEERLDDEMTGKLKAAPSGLGSASELSCAVSLGCCSYPVASCTMGRHLILALPDSVLEPAVAPPAHPSRRSNASCALYKLTPDRDLYAVPLEGCGVIRRVFGETVVHLLEVHGIHSLQRGHSSELVNSPVRLMVACSSSPGSPGEVRLHVMAQPPPPAPVHSPPPAVTLRIAKDESFTGFHPEAHLPLSLLRGRPVYVEVSLLNPPRPGLVLLVHSCLAYTRAPYESWMLIYDGCLDRGYSERLLPPHHEPRHTWRVVFSGFLSLHSPSLSFTAGGGYTQLQDPEIYFLCLTEVCSAAHGDCAVGCINGPKSET
ncbi:uncharacterized protein LOC119220619 [Pungitius pungitius]|uniref:uncharacterized protein LOC119220619 n=1 Tax=Pungitius pungitius TaxID=134920 RepID=UPI002E145DDD